MKNNIFEKYNDFILHKKIDEIKDSVDFLGINISNNSNEDFDFKVYCEVQSKQYNHKLLKFLEQNEMLRYSSVVITDTASSSERYEIGLNNRNNNNMNKLNRWLSENVSFYDEYSDIIEYFSKMENSQESNYSNAAFYFLGFTGENEGIDVIKTHFLTRKCKNPVISHKEFEFDDEYYLKYIVDSEIEEMKAIATLAKKALTLCGGHLWMTGFDCAYDKSYKYKIYIKKSMHAYDALTELFGDTANGGILAEKIDSVAEWNAQNPQYCMEGFAVGIDSKKILSVNFYY